MSGLPTGPGPMLGRRHRRRRCLALLSLSLSLLAVTAPASASRAGPAGGPVVGPGHAPPRGVGSLTARVLGPRMDYDEWTPLGHGDPLKNDPTFDYVPPVLDRVHYWMEAKESNARRDEAFENVPVPPTMLVPPPPPPAPTTPPPPLTPAPPLAASYSSLNPFHHFEDRPVVPNVLFEERPLSFEAPRLPPVGPPGPPPVHLPVVDKPRDTPAPPASSNVVFFDVEKQQLEQPLLGPQSPAGTHLGPVSALGPVSPPVGPVSPPLGPVSPPLGPVSSAVGPVTSPVAPAPFLGPFRPPTKQPSKSDDKPNSIRSDNKLAPGKVALPGQNLVRGGPTKPNGHGKPLRLDGPPPQPPAGATTPTTPSSPQTTTTTTTPSTTTDRVEVVPAVPHESDNDISALVRGLLHPEPTTTATAMTTDPLFAHYKQPATPVNVHGPAYLIIQGHSKVKTYGPVLRRYDPPQGPPQSPPQSPPQGVPLVLRGPLGPPGRRHSERAP